MKIDDLIMELMNYGIAKELVDDADIVYTTNRLLELFEVNDYQPDENDGFRELHLILEDMMSWGC